MKVTYQIYRREMADGRMEFDARACFITTYFFGLIKKVERYWLERNSGRYTLTSLQENRSTFRVYEYEECVKGIERAIKNHLDTKKRFKTVAYLEILDKEFKEPF